jgi:uncharacterized protein (UPF0261 family)
VAITTLGTTDRALKFILPRLEKSGFIPIIFHSSGVGGQVMEDMIERGYFCGVVDLCINELTDHLVGAYHDAGPDRLKTAAKMGSHKSFPPGASIFLRRVPEKPSRRNGMTVKCTTTTLNSP